MRVASAAFLLFPLLSALTAGCGTSPQNAGPPAPAPATGPAPGGEAPAAPAPLVNLTPRAAARVRELLLEVKDAKYLRVSVVDGSTKLDLDPSAAVDDFQLESQGVRIVVDRPSAEALPPGTLVDYIDGPGQQGFKVTSSAAALGTPDTSRTLPQARQGFRTTITRPNAPGAAPAEPPPALFRLVRYDSPVGPLPAYLTPDPGDGRRRPAIVWITGGDCNTIDRGCWTEGGGGNDQSASAYRKAGLVMMFPSQRGGNANPGPKEAFLGEVDDVVAAGEFLAKQPHVDPARIYLGGHSTGGTLALLVAECSDRFRAVFAFGPTDDVVDYGPGMTPFSLREPLERRLRAPVLWLHGVRCPTFVIEGEGGNRDALRALAAASSNPRVRCLEIRGADHFDLLAPVNRLIAAKLLADAGPECRVALTEAELARAVRR